MMLFTGIFDALAQIEYDPELFSKALPCLSAIGCALSPDYSLTRQDEEWIREASEVSDGSYRPRPVDTSRYIQYIYELKYIAVFLTSMKCFCRIDNCLNSHYDEFVATV